MLKSSMKLCYMSIEKNFFFLQHEDGRQRKKKNEKYIAILNEIAKYRGKSSKVSKSDIKKARGRERE